MMPSQPLGAGPAEPPLPWPDPAPGHTHAHAYATLRAERVRVAHWRRLVRARMDLAAAALALPEALGQHVVGVLPDDVRDDAPTHLGLLDAVSTSGPEGEIDRLEALRVLDRRLARYESAVTRALQEAASAVVPRRPSSAPEA